MRALIGGSDVAAAQRELLLVGMLQGDADRESVREEAGPQQWVMVR